MGGLFSSRLSAPSSLSIDFAHSKISDDSEFFELFQENQALIDRGKSTLPEVESYSGCEDLIRLAMSKPADVATQISTFEGMFPNVIKIRNFYTLGKEVDEACGKLIRLFVEIESLETVIPLLKQLIELLAFALTFDRCKMMRPAIQNDFSFYRRALQKNARHQGVPVNDVDANNISMFIAQAAPIISIIVVTMDNLQRSIQVTNFLVEFTHICCSSSMGAGTQNAQDNKMALTAMVAAIVVYDQISPMGAFASSSSILLRPCLNQLKTLSTEERGALCDALQYSTKTFNKAPEWVKKSITSR